MNFAYSLAKRSFYFANSHVAADTMMAKMSDARILVTRSLMTAGGFVLLYV